MLERPKDWDDFLSCLRRNQPHSVMCEHFKIPFSHVLHYRDMFDGVPVLEKFSNLTAAQLASAVGFKYKVVIRWIDTDAIVKARRDYDNGLTEMYTGPALCRGEIVRVIYSKARVQKVIRPAYFSAVVPA